MKRLMVLFSAFLMVMVFTLPVSAKVERVQGPWNLTGSCVLDYHDQTPNLHDAQFVQTGTALTGSGGYQAGDTTYQYPWTIISGSVVGNVVNFTAQYHDTVASIVDGTTWSFTGTINSGVLNGTWNDTAWGYPRSGTMTSTSSCASQFTGNHWQHVSSQEDKQEAAQ